MAQSARFNALDKRIKELRTRFLPAKFSPSGTYSNEELDKARAFRVLVHAEFEHYLEDRALDIAVTAYDLLKAKSRVSRPIVHILANVVGEQEGLPSKLGTNRTVLSIAGKVLAQYKHRMTRNNGIRTDNLLEILLPVGVSEIDLDAAWLSTTDGFGAKRGLTAHTSAIAQPLDPQDDHNVVLQIMSGMKDVDTLLNSIRRKIR
jgi:hypothetical protein